MKFDEIYAYTQDLSILYVEDEASVRESTRTLLENYFKRVDSAKDGKEGLEQYRAMFEKECYNIVLTDMNMPFFTGVEMAEAIRHINPDQVVVFVSAHNEQKFLLDAIKLGVNYYLIKPIDLDELGKILFQSAKLIVNQIKVADQLADEKERVERNEHYQKALQKWANIDFEDTVNSIRKTTELSAKTLNIGRVSIWLMNEEKRAMVCKDLYELDEDTHTKGTTLIKERFPNYFQALNEKKIMVVDDARDDPRTSEFRSSYLEPLGIYSMLDIPIIQNEELLGVICHEAIGEPHSWRIEEQEFAMTLANNIALSLEIKKRYEMQEKLQRQKELLDYQAHHDHLTGLPNRTLFIDRLEQAIKHNQRQETQVALLFIDLDHFKQINDSMGHDAGDRVLKILAKRLEEQIRKGDTLARLGGDEFTLILDSIQEMKVIVGIIQKLLECTKDVIMIDEQELYVTLSIGITIYPYDGITVKALLKNADAAMYKAKEDGRNTYQYYTPEMTKKAVERIVMEGNLRQAIAKEELLVYYQPQYSGIDDSIIGMEALVRWNHDNKGAILPDKFIPLAEDTGLIVEIDRWVMETSIRQFAQWYEAGLNPGKLSLNLSMKQLHKSDCIDLLKSLLEKYGFCENWLTFEITEGRIMKNPEAAIATLEEIRALGVTLAIDDFGTGYSSLSYLKRLPIDTLKIDRAFIKELPDDEEDEAISKAIIALGKSLKLNVIAEGVETLEQKTFLVEQGCHLIQGYYYARPLPADEIENGLKSGTI
ncbi:MAG: EAL domain-containing protein [Campylobacterota bacterium]|nr:EAL domain-containing protein [Campylobacterota bacterium]